MNKANDSKPRTPARYGLYDRLKIKPSLKQMNRIIIVIIILIFLTVAIGLLAGKLPK